MRTLSTVSLVAATLSVGMVAGLMADWAYTTMPGLGRSSDRTFVEGLQELNRAIQNGWFMLTFMGAIAFAGLATFLAWRGHGRAALPWIVAGLALYLVTFIITMAINVPLNEQIDKAGDPAQIKDLAAVRADFNESKWFAWHIVRTLANIAAFGCLAWALVIHGGQRDEPSEAGRSTGPESQGTYRPVAAHNPQPYQQPYQQPDHQAFQQQPYQPQAQPYGPASAPPARHL